MEVVNDNSCSWINDLSSRNNIKTLSSDLDCEWLIIGAGYTGLSAARKLGQLYPNKELDNYKKKADIYKLGIEAVKRFIKEYQVDCDWNESGKYFASSKQEDIKILENFSDTLSKLGFEHNLLSNK